MRAPDSQVVVHTENLSGIYKSKVTRIPFLRGLVMLWDALGLGMRALTISANVQTDEEQKLEGPALYLTLGVSLLLGVGLFFLLPAVVGQLAERLLGINAWWGNLAEGVMRLLLLVGYIWAVGRIPDIRRVFAYHGAEHKTINAFEANDREMTPESIARFPRQHARCGTAFLLTVVVFSILLFALLGPMPIGLRLLSRILLIPVVAGLAYEYIRWTGRHQHTWWAQLLLLPNLGLQALTTREPETRMIEVALSAFQALRAAERQSATQDR
jgi:uncharacterized protein YqhQ